MKLSANAVIAREKLTGYLLRKLPENDKSAFLAQAGNTPTIQSGLRRTCGTRF